MKKRLFSGIQPSGELHIGNYLGAIKNWLEYLDTYECLFSLVDCHALTIPYDPAEMPERLRHLATMFLACGLTPDRCVIFRQSDVQEHTQLAWFLNCITPMNLLERMIQFKEKSEQHSAINNGLFSYPVLQAADILLYKADLVPVGEDQLQHLELSRDIARKFNLQFGEFFPEPKPLLGPARRIMGLDGKNKMSKSLGNHLALSDSAETLRNKLKRAVTDERRKRLSDPGEPNDCNIFAYHQFFSSEEQRNDIAPRCRTATISCLECKNTLADNLVTELAPIRENYERWQEKPQEVNDILADGADKARAIAQETMKEVKERMGLKL